MVSPHAVLGTEEGYQFYVRRAEQDIDRRDEMCIDTRRVGDETNPLPSQEVEPAFTQDLNAGTDGWRLSRERTRDEDRNDCRTQQMSHKAPEWMTEYRAQSPGTQSDFRQ
jgi:hypothetical protein